LHHWYVIEHRTTRVKRPQSNGIVERLHRTLLDEHFRVETAAPRSRPSEEMRTVLDSYLEGQRRPHQGRGMNGRTPAQAFVEGLPNRASQPHEENAKQHKPTSRKATLKHAA
jgi:transposase InsO family protein